MPHRLFLQVSKHMKTNYWWKTKIKCPDQDRLTYLFFSFI
jgi:hypothetical protein